MDSASSRPGEQELSDWIVDQIADALQVDRAQIPLDQPFSRLGLDSTDAVVLSGTLSEWLGRRIPPTAAWDHPTVQALARHLAQ